MPTTKSGSRECGPPRQKSVLFCANCGHDSHVEGDWIVHERSGSRSLWYQCPECGRSVSVRPAQSLEESTLPFPMSPGSARGTYGKPRETVPQNELWGEVWETYRHVTTAWLTPWRRSFVKAD